jgi:hypothetical protein
MAMSDPDVSGSSAAALALMLVLICVVCFSVGFEIGRWLLSTNLL